MSNTVNTNTGLRKKWSIAFLVLLYVCGIIGIYSSLHVSLVFNSLTPVTLIISALLLILNHEEKNSTFYVFCLLVFVSGFLIELIGVRTGWIFGNYIYGETLGPQLTGIPVIIGLNWLILTYCAGTVAGKIPGNIFMKAIFGSTIMVVLDIFIEPVATHYGYWFWENDTVPFRNYAGWFICSFVFLLLFYSMGLRRGNSVAGWLLALQFAFFIALGLNHTGTCS